MWASGGLSNKLWTSWDRDPREALSFPKVIPGELRPGLEGALFVAPGIGRVSRADVESTGAIRGDCVEARETGRDAELL
ncbi:hypothetical protein IMZ48_11230 [Candidatus Bathyarchaeota archaeon]|nr:hypothetical protein [Candidatus Bathyarchaeota archaeon]